MKVLLIYPKYPDTFWSFKYAMRFISKKAAFPPLGLLTVAAMLPKKWEIKLVDLNVRKLTDKDIFWADMIFVSAMLIQKESAQEIIDQCKDSAKFGEKIVVAGGPVFTTSYDKFSNVDHFVLGEAEVTLPLFLDDLKNGVAKELYVSEVRPDLIKTPVPLWSLINFRDYSTMAVQFSRGCPFDCEFCGIVVMHGHKPRLKSIEQIIAEFQALYDAGWRGAIFFYDDNFIGNKRGVKAMLRVLIEWLKEHNYPFTLLTQASVDLADDEELMRLMSQANFNKVFLGIETTNVDSLRECNKMHNINKDLTQVIEIIQQYGMQVMGGYIVGFDNDTENIFDALISFIQKTGVVTAMVGMLEALPKTRLWNRLEKEGRLIEDASGDNADANVNFIPKMGIDKLIAGYRDMIAKLYSRKYYYQRISNFIRSYRPTAKKRVSGLDLKAFFRSMWRIGLFSRFNFLYWKLLVKAFFINIKAFPMVVELIIIGMHLQKVARIVSQAP